MIGRGAAGERFQGAGYEEDFRWTCRGGIFRRCYGRNIEFCRSALVGLGLWWLGRRFWLPCRLLRRLGLSRLGLGTGRLCRWRGRRGCAGGAFLFLSAPGLSHLLLLLLSGASLLLLRCRRRLLLLSRYFPVCFKRPRQSRNGCR